LEDHQQEEVEQQEEQEEELAGKPETPHERVNPAAITQAPPY